ncbi:MAG: hypothetical protein HS115_16225 [Spirochaetales bacterium]|nr:hypothetical protein [Spirochaetales bacterium]
MRSSGFKHLVLSIAFLLPHYLPSSPALRSLEADFAYQPRKEEAYLQAWNVTFRRGADGIFLTFLVSNFGPGDLNHGVSLLLVQNGKSIVHTAEYAKATLQATPGKFGHKSHIQRLWKEGSEIKSYVNINNVEIEMSLLPQSGGVRLSGGPVQLGGGSFFRADVPVMAAKGKARLKVNGKMEEWSGEGGMEYIAANKSAHSFARRFTVIRTFSAGEGLFVGGLMGTGGFPDLYRAGFMEKGQLTGFAEVAELKVLRSEQNTFSGYTLPSVFEFSLRNQPCKIEIQRKGFIGGYYVLGNVSKLLRWVLSVFFAKPFILQFSGEGRLVCSGKTTLPAGFVGKKIPVQISFYPINP